MGEPRRTRQQLKVDRQIDQILAGRVVDEDEEKAALRAARVIALKHAMADLSSPDPELRKQAYRVICDLTPRGGRKDAKAAGAPDNREELDALAEATMAAAA